MNNIDQNDADDLFSDAYVAHRKARSIEAIEQAASDNSHDKQTQRWAKNTHKRTKKGPETKIKATIKKHLEQHYNAKVLRTNAGAIQDQQNHTIWLGETGQSDLHALVPLKIDNIVLGLFVAIECKANNNKPTVAQNAYLDNINARGGLSIVAYNIIDVDDAIARRRAEIAKWLRSRQNSA